MKEPLHGHEMSDALFFDTRINYLPVLATPALLADRADVEGQVSEMRIYCLLHQFGFDF